MRLLLVLACAMTGGWVQPAVAQDTAPTVAQVPLLTLDDERLFSGSAFGKAVLARQDEETRALIDENRRIEAALETEEKRPHRAAAPP